MKSKITTDYDDENDTRDNIDEVLSFSQGLTRENNTNGDDRNDQFEDNEFYTRDDHLERNNV